MKYAEVSSARCADKYEWKIDKSQSINNPGHVSHPNKIWAPWARHSFFIINQADTTAGKKTEAIASRRIVRKKSAALSELEPLDVESSRGQRHGREEKRGRVPPCIRKSPAGVCQLSWVTPYLLMDSPLMKILASPGEGKIRSVSGAEKKKE
jgi:hypothetical protein